MFDNMAIKDLAKLCHVSTRTLRYYEEVGLLKPRRLENNYRVYGFDAVGRVEMILTLKKSGMQLDQIKALLSEPQRIEGVLQAQKTALHEEMQRLEQSIAFIDGQQRLARLFREHGLNRLFVCDEPCRQYETVRRLARGEITILMECDEVGMAIEATDSPEAYIVRPLPTYKNAPTIAAFFSGEWRIRRRQRAFMELLSAHHYTAKSLIYSESCCLLGKEDVHLMWCEAEQSPIGKPAGGCHNERKSTQPKEENTMVKDRLL